MYNLMFLNGCLKLFSQSFCPPSDSRCLIRNSLFINSLPEPACRRLEHPHAPRYRLRPAINASGTFRIGPAGGCPEIPIDGLEIIIYMSFEQLNLSAEILHAIADQGYTEPTPIQAQAIPGNIGRPGYHGSGSNRHRQDRRLYFAHAQPSSARSQYQRIPGETSHSCTYPGTNPRVGHPGVRKRKNLRKVPAAQVRCGFRWNGYRPADQRTAGRRGNTSVATPGRLLDHIQQKTMSLSKVEILVLDEADRMLDMGFLPDIKRILGLMPEQRQSLLFSATFSEEIKKLANKLLRDPVLIEVARRNSIADLITHVVHPVKRGPATISALCLRTS